MSVLVFISRRLQSNVGAVGAGVFPYLYRFIIHVSALVFATVIITATLSIVIRIESVIEAPCWMRPKQLQAVHAQIDAVILKVRVADNQSVSEGDTLVELFASGLYHERSYEEIAFARKTKEFELAGLEKTNTEAEALEMLALSKIEHEHFLMSASQYRDEWVIENEGRSTQRRTPLDMRQAFLDTAMSWHRIKLREAGLERARDLQGKIEMLGLERGLIKAKILALDSELKKSIIVAPSDGFAWCGGLAERRGGSLKKGELIIRIMSNNEWSVRAIMKDGDVSRLYPGQTARVLFNSLPFLRHQIFNAKVLTISNPVKMDQAEPTYFVDCVINDPGLTRLIQDGHLVNGIGGRVLFSLGKSPLYRAIWDHIRDRISVSSGASAISALEINKMVEPGE